MKYDFETIVNRYPQGSEKWLSMKNKNDQINDDIIPFSIADMEFVLAPEISEGLIDYIKKGAVLGYTLPTDEYYNSVINWMKMNHNWDISKEWICVSNGVIPALYDLVKAYTKVGDGVIVMPPVYYPFYSAVEANNRKIVSCSLKNNNMHYEIDFSLLRKLARKPENKLLILCSPHNPVGRVWSIEELKELANICMENDVIIISDEIHNDLIMPGFTHTVLASINKDISNNVITCTAPSKTFNLAGVQASNIIIENSQLRNLYKEEQSRSGFDCMGSFAYLTCKLAYNYGKDWYKELIKMIYNNYNVLKKYLSDNLPQVKVYPLEGTYLVWLDFSAFGLTKEELEEKLIKDCNVFMDEGHMFGDEGNLFERMNIACPTSKIVEALDRICKVFNHKK